MEPVGVADRVVDNDGVTLYCTKTVTTYLAVPLLSEYVESENFEAMTSTSKIMRVGGHDMFKLLGVAGGTEEHSGAAGIQKVGVPSLPSVL